MPNHILVPYVPHVFGIVRSPQAVENTMPHPTADTNKDEETHSATDGNDGTLAGSADAPAPPQTSQVALKQRAIKGHPEHPSKAHDIVRKKIEVEFITSIIKDQKDILGEHLCLMSKSAHGHPRILDLSLALLDSPIFSHYLS